MGEAEPKSAGAESSRDEWMTRFGTALRAARNRAGLTQPELAQRSGLSIAYISSVELGHRNIGLVNIHRLAEALDLSVKAFFS